jgi:uncharacterized membrane protein YhaH (DUF805 family)
MNFFRAIASCFNKFVVFSGRASRSEYWFFFLFRIVCYYVGGMVDKNVLHDYMQAISYGHFAIHLGILGIILHIFFLLPAVAVGARRLHDIDKSGWWLLSALILIGILPLLAWLCSKGTQGDNRFGPDPLTVKP